MSTLQNWDRPVGGPNLAQLLASRKAGRVHLADLEAGHYDHTFKRGGRAWAVDGQRRHLAQLQNLIDVIETVERENSLMDLEA